MRTPLVAGNWKMNGTRESVNRLVSEVIQDLDDEPAAEILVCPPFVYLNEVQRLVKDSALGLGAQNLCAEASGAFTGEVAGSMLAEFGVSHVIVGHSERRSLYAESDSQVARKFIAAQKAGLIPILCVGETLDEREQGDMTTVVGRQLDRVLDVAGVAAFEQAVIAYEPVWAIGTGQTATPEQAQEAHAFIRDTLRRRDGTIADCMRLLYGGSVKAANAAELFALPDVDGGLIGGASLDAAEFLKICSAARSH